MRKSLLLATGCWLLATAVLGCQDPQKTSYVALQAYTSSASLMVQCRREKLLDDQEWQTVKQLDADAYAALIAYRQALTTGQGQLATKRAFDAALDAIIDQYRRKGGLKEVSQ